jgi:DNA-binding LytR/AlgR family response regulator
MLKIKLDVSTEKEEEIKETLEKLGIIISDDADYVLSENMENSHIVCKKGEQIHQIPIAEIVYIESQDHYLIIRTKNDFYYVRETIHYYEKHLPSDFIRVHRSYIVNKNMIEYITPLLGMRFNLLMATKEKISVSRSYYFQFKEKIGI